MFNKTEILRNQKTNFLFKTRPKLHKSYNMKKSLTNLKISSGININSSNGSNINLKTSSNSKIEPDSASIKNIQNFIPQRIKNSLFDYKDKEKNKLFWKNKENLEKFSKSNQHNNKNDNISLSAKMNKFIKLKLRRKTHLNSDENEIQSKGYYLTGELPFKDKYIVEIKDFDLNNSKKGENSIIKNQNIKNQKINKNEFIQCDSVNNSCFKTKILNMKTADKRIDNLAKKLAIKLNLEDKNDSNESKCGCGNNLITLKNGFFNGVNLVMSLTPKKEKNENNETKNFENNEENDKNNQNNTQPGNIYSNGYNHIPTNLPLFLRDKFNIKGTTILSPFCIEARDEFLFKKIFYEGERKKMSKRSNIIDNKLNIFYAPNHKQYVKNLIKFNEKLKKKGKKILQVGPTPTEKKLNSIKEKMSFMKKIVDYAYPNMVLARVRETEKVNKKRNKSELSLPPFMKAEILQKQRNRILGDFLKQSFYIQHPMYK